MATAADRSSTATTTRDPSVRITEPDRPKPPPLESQMSSAGTSMDLPKTPTRLKEKEKKLGHRRVDEAGQVTYKKKPTSELMAAMQLGIGQSITILSTKPKRDLLLQDFSIIETVFFPREGSNLTPAHSYSDFRFKTFAPIAFRYFRELFSIQPEDFLLSLCNEALNELSNPGASGSIFYITTDDEFIIKTVQHKEAEFLQKLLPGYYMNLNQNPRTLLPKFYGLYCYQCGGKNIRFVVMNNLLPSSIKMHEKYDLKGSTYKRKASKNERSKRSPTLKDLDFMELHPEGIMLEADTHSALINTITRDCRVLQSFKIMDYSLLLGIHNLDQAAKEKNEELEGAGTLDSTLGGVSDAAVNKSADTTINCRRASSVSRGKSMRQRVAQYSTAMEAIAARSEPLELDNEDIPPGGIPARNSKGERLLLYIGIIDILQSYRLKKKMEHALKAMVHDGDTISVHRPGFYSERFQKFFAEKIFRKIPSSLRQSPSKRRPPGGGITPRQRSVTTSEVEGRTTVIEKLRSSSDATEPAGAVGGRPDLLPENSTPPPTFAEATAERRALFAQQDNANFRKPEVMMTSPTFPPPEQPAPASAGAGIAGFPLHSPAHSVSESTPTHTEYTEGTPSFTTSSPSCSSEFLDSLPSTTKSQRREFNGNISPSPASPLASGEQKSNTSKVELEMSEDKRNTARGDDVKVEDVKVDVAADNQPDEEDCEQ